jgi:outer membrane protein insertion porin family
VKITTTVTPIERNRVNVVFAVDEGDVARIKQINIVGNKAFSDKELREQLALNTGGWFSWYTKADQYSKTKLTGDIESLKSFYLDRGYIEMQVDSTQVSITPDKKDIYITINITEGEKYKVSGTKFEGEMFGREEELKALNLMRDGDIYSGARLTATNKRSRTAWARSATPSPTSTPIRDRPRKARSGVHLLHRSGQARLRAPHEHRRQHHHAR